MEGKLVCRLELDYINVAYPPLANLCVHKEYDKEKKKYIWDFYAKDLNGVVRILGKPITFENEAAQVEKIVGLCPPIKSKIEAERYKGIGETTFVEEPEIFLIGEWQKDPKTGIPKQSWQRIPKEMVLVNWGIVQEYPLNKWVKIKTQAEHVCRRLGFDKLFRDSGTFDWSKFSGLHRKGHLPYCYYPVKILARLGVIEYSKIGKLKRIKDKLEFQLKFRKDVGKEDIIKRG